MKLTLRLNNLYISSVRCCRSFLLKSRETEESDKRFSRHWRMHLAELESDWLFLLFWSFWRLSPPPWNSMEGHFSIWWEPAWTKSEIQAHKPKIKKKFRNDRFLKELQLDTIHKCDAIAEKAKSKSKGMHRQ